MGIKWMFTLSSRQCHCVHKCNAIGLSSFCIAPVSVLKVELGKRADGPIVELDKQRVKHKFSRVYTCHNVFKAFSTVSVTNDFTNRQSTLQDRSWIIEMCEKTGGRIQDDRSPTVFHFAQSTCMLKLHSYVEQLWAGVVSWHWVAQA